MLGEPDDLLARPRRQSPPSAAPAAYVGYVRVAFEDADFEAIPATAGRGARVGTWPRRPQRLPHDRGYGRVAPQDGDIIVRKVRVGAFSTTDLDAQLRGRGIDTSILAGSAPAGVVLWRSADASDRDYRVLVLQDATADREPDVHAFLTERIFPRQADVITVADLDALLQPADPE